MFRNHFACVGKLLFTCLICRRSLQWFILTRKPSRPQTIFENADLTPPTYRKIKILFLAILQKLTWACDFSIQIEVKNAKISQISATALYSFLRIFSYILYAKMLFVAKVSISELINTCLDIQKKSLQPYGKTAKPWKYCSFIRNFLWFLRRIIFLRNPALDYLFKLNTCKISRIIIVFCKGLNFLSRPGGGAGGLRCWTPFYYE